MMKKMVALVLAAALCLCAAQVAQATNCPSHAYIAQRTGRTRILPVTTRYHQRHIEFICVCVKCGATTDFVYIPDLRSERRSHLNNAWKNYNPDQIDYHQCYACEIL